MASSITSSAAFTTTNMKPAADEQIDALWGQNIADNTGYVYYRTIPGPSFHSGGINNAGGGTRSGTFYFRKEAGFATMMGSISGTLANVTNQQIYVRINGTTVFNQLFKGTLFKASFGTDCVGMSNGSDYELTFDWGIPSNVGEGNLNVTSWQKP